METPQASHGSWIRFVICFCFLLILTPGGQAGPAEGRQWLLGQMQQDGSLNNEATLATAFQATTESVETFRIQPDAEPGDLSGVAAYLAAAAPDQSAENLARRLIASQALGLDFNADRQALMARQHAYSGFGAFPGFDADAVSTAFALQALHRLGVTQEPAAYSLQYLLDSQLDNGGWALDGETAQVQTTALAMHALWLYRNQYSVSAALDAAQSFLLGERDGALWVDTEQSALALIALLSRAVDRSPYKPALAALADRQNPAGDFDGGVYVTALALRALALGALPPQDLTRLTGRLVDAQTGQPLADGRVSLSGGDTREARTGADGVFVFENLPTGQYRIEADKAGYGTLVLNTVVQTGDKRDLGSLALDLRQTDPDTGEPVSTGLLRGRVTASEDGAALAGATLTLGGSGRSVTTGPDGRYVIGDIVAGPVTVTASAPGYRTAVGSAEVQAGQTLVFSPALRVAVTQGVNVEGRVTEQASGDAVAGALVSARVGDTTKSVSTDAQGDYRLTRLPAGEVALTVSADGYASVSGQAQADDGDTLSFSPRLVPAGEPPVSLPGGFRGVVVDGITGRGIEGAEVRAEQEDGLETLFTDADGHFVIDTLSAGDVSLTISASDYASISATARVEAGFISDVGEVELTPLDEAVNSVAGRVVDVRTGEPLEGVLAQVKPQASSSTVVAEALSGPDGGFEVPRLRLDDYVLVLSLTDYQDLTVPFLIASGGVLEMGELRMRPPGIDALLPDLAIQSTATGGLSSDPDTFAASGDLDVVVINRGNTALDQSFRVLAFSDRDRDGAFDPDTDVALGEQVVDGALDVDTTRLISIAVDGPLPFRDAPITVMLDADEAVSELSEANNLESTAGECVNNQKPYLDLALCLDASGSVSRSEFQLQLEGTARAIENPDIVPRDGSVRLSLLQFSSYDRLEINPTLIEEDNVGQLADAIRAVPKMGGGTSIHQCIDGAANTITQTTPPAALRVIDVSTDGQSSQSSAVAAANRARDGGVDVLNAIGVGSGANENLLNAIVFPEPVGGDRGFVLMVDSYQEYIEGIAGKIAKETRIPDLTVGGLKLVDHGTGEPVSLEVVIGNAGSAAITEDITVTFFNGDANTGEVIGEVTLQEGIDAGAFRNVSLDDVPVAALNNGTVRAAAEIAGNVSECNTGNNGVSIPLTVQRGEVSLGLSSSAPSPMELLGIDALVGNTGAVAGDYRVTLRIEDTKGVLVADLGEHGVDELAAGQQYQRIEEWGTGVTLTGAYRAVADLYNASGRLLDSDQAAFRITEEGDPSAPVASVRVGADRPEYRLGDTVMIESSLSNTSLGTPIPAPRYRLVVAGPDGQVVLSEETALGGLAIGQVLTLPDRLALADLPVGGYAVTGTLFASNDQVLARDQAGFSVAADPLRALLGGVSVEAESVFLGDAQSCHFRLRNSGERVLEDIGVRRARVDLDNQLELADEAATVTLASGEERTFTDTFSTAGFNLTRHACVLQVADDGESRDLGNATFQITEPPVSLATSLGLSGGPRLLVLADKEVSTCMAVRTLTLEAVFPETLSPFARVHAKVLGRHFRIEDMESATPRFFDGPVNHGDGRDVDLTLMDLDRERLTVRLQGEGLVDGDYSLKAFYPALLFLHKDLDSGEVRFECGEPPRPGDVLGDFKVTEVELVEKVRRDGGEPEVPAIAAQRQWLDDTLAERDYALVDSLESFGAAVRSGDYQQYLLLADRIPVEHWTAKQLREAVNRGEGLVYAAGNLPEAGPLYEVLGIQPHRERPGFGWHHHHQPRQGDYADGVLMERSPLGDAGFLPFAFNRELALVHRENSHVAGQYQNLRLGGGHGRGRHCPLYPVEYPAVTYRDYGQGRTVFAGFDLAAEGTAEPSTQRYAGLLDAMLAFTETDLTITRPGAVVPVTLTVENTGPAVAVEARLTLEDGGEVLATLPRTGNGQPVWQFELAERETRSLRAWVRPDYRQGVSDLSARLQASAPSGAAKSFEEALRIGLHADAPEDLSEIESSVRHALWQTPWDLALKHAALSLHQAGHAREHGRTGDAIKLALKTTTSLRASRHRDADALRRRLDWVIWALNKEGN
ncbi:von Willebrand factor type A domain-containing protein [Alcanivorax marinus]|nr:von Willebrand factor type A domain-containing protein [Alloalcanivorax marinus]